jgi:hypothetical protein
MIDEAVLRRALVEAADEFKVSSEARERILDAAQEDAPEVRVARGPTFLRPQGRTRSILVAAALLLVVGAISWPLLRSERGNSPSASAPRTVHGVGVNGTGFSGLNAPEKVVVGGLPTYTASGTASQSGATVSNTALTVNTSTSTKIESTGNVDLRIGKGQVEVAFAKLTRMVSGDRGFVVSSQERVGTNSAGKFSYGIMVLEVPQRSFDTLVTQVQKAGHPTSVVTSSSDVTSQYVDLRARINAAEASRQQYLTIMSKATSIGDILAVQSQLNNLQSQIEQLQGQLNVLNNATTYGTLTVSLSETGQHHNVTKLKSGFAKAWHDGVSGFISGFEWVVRLAGPALFAVLALGAAFVIVRYARRAIRRRRI